MEIALWIVTILVALVSIFTIRIAYVTVDLIRSMATGTEKTVGVVQYARFIGNRYAFIANGEKWPVTGSLFAKVKFKEGDKVTVCYLKSYPAVAIIVDEIPSSKRRAIAAIIISVALLVACLLLAIKLII